MCQLLSGLLGHYPKKEKLKEEDTRRGRAMKTKKETDRKTVTQDVKDRDKNIKQANKVLLFVKCHQIQN